MGHSPDTRRGKRIYRIRTSRDLPYPPGREAHDPRRIYRGRCAGTSHTIRIDPGQHSSPHPHRVLSGSLPAVPQVLTPSQCHCHRRLDVLTECVGVSRLPSFETSISSMWFPLEVAILSGLLILARV